MALVEECDEKPQSLPLLLVRSEDDEKISLCSVAQIEKPPVNSVRTVNELRSKKICNSHHDWLVLVDKDEQYSLWNVLTSEFITLPHLDLAPEQKVNDSILTSPLDLDNSKLILLEETGPSLICCNIRYSEWTYYPIKEDFMQGRHLISPVMCDGTLYARTHDARGQLVKIDLTMPDHVQLVAPELSVSVFQLEARGLLGHIVHMIPSTGELFFIIMYFARNTWKDWSHPEVIDLEIYNLDLSTMEIKVVEIVKDRAFFICSDGSFSCLADGLNVKGNHIYFTFGCDKRVYAFNMDDKTISVSLVHPNFQNLRHHLVWINTNSRIGDDRQNKEHDLFNGNEEKFDDKIQMRHSADESYVRGEFGKLYKDMLFEIGKRLILGDYASFRSCNKECRVECPRIQWTGPKLEGFEDYARSIPPWLVYWKLGDEVCHYLDIVREERYFMNLPNNSLKDVTMCHSGFGWCVMLHGQKSIFLWNPFTKNIISLPNLTFRYKYVVGCTLTPNIANVFVVYQCDQASTIELIYLREGKCNQVIFDGLNFEVGLDGNLINYDKHVWLFDKEGNLAGLRGSIVDGILKLKIDYKVATPCPSFRHSFLIKCDEQEILSVFVGDMGEWVRIFTFNSGEKEWVEIENLQNKTLYISQFSCFSTAALDSEMGNRIYFSRYNCVDNRIIYYSLSSKKLHTHGTDQVIESFNNTKVQLFSSWVEVKWW